MQVPADCIDVALQLVEGSAAPLEELCNQIVDVVRPHGIANGKENETGQHQKVGAPTRANIRCWICQVRSFCMHRLLSIPFLVTSTLRPKRCMLPASLPQGF